MTKTKPAGDASDEITRLETINREFSKKIGDLEDEVKRNHKTVEGYIAENEALKRELGKAPAPLQVASASFGGGLVVVAETNAALCAGCYRLRLWFALVAGITASGFLALKLYAKPDVLQNVAHAVTGRDDAAYPVLVTLGILCAAGPALAVAAHWKWTQFKSGAPGLLRSAAEVWDVVKQAFKRGKR